MEYCWCSGNTVVVVVVAVEILLVVSCSGVFLGGSSMALWWWSAAILDSRCGVSARVLGYVMLVLGGWCKLGPLYFGGLGSMGGVGACGEVVM